ncbi:glycosyltransferase family 4 protein [Halobaculum sp. EA56]|uniref:glycosyltransferase family 4 protein n=1 Tax=Halobaculum sp. EA56 TaxID=3421648 RepID=UPI003EBAE59C
MRVLNSFTDPRMGGPQQRGLSVAKELRDRGIETVFVVPDGTDEFVDAATEAGFKVRKVSPHQVTKPRNIYGNLRFLKAVLPMICRTRRIISEEEVDVVHVNTPVNVHTALAAARSDASVVWHFNDTALPTPVKEVTAAAGRLLADKLVVAADAVGEYYFPDSQSTRTLYAPVDLDRFDPERVSIDEPAIRESLGIPDKVPVVGTIGNVNPIKGHKYLLQAIAQIAPERPVAVPIVGAKLDTRTAYFDQLLELRSELGLNDQVQFVGFRSDVPALLKLFDLFVLSSTAEACPIVVLEAMAMETPIVATDVGGVPEQLPSDNYGWVIPSEHPDAMADAIEAALADPDERRRRAANARNHVEEEFSLAACVRRHEEIYRSVQG